MNISRSWWHANRLLVVFSCALTILVTAIAIPHAFSLSCTSGVATNQCGRILSSDGLSSLLSLTLAIIPILLGVVLGVDAVGGEVDRRTCWFAWSIATDRKQWLRERALPGLLATALIGLACGIVNAILVIKLNPGHNILASYVGYGLWGPILAVRGVCAYALGLLIGALSGRMIASIALSLLLATAVIPVALIAGRSFETATIIPSNDPASGDAMGVQMGVLRSDGTIGPEGDCFRAEPSGLTPDEELQWSQAHCRTVVSFLRGSQMVDEELRESVVLGVIAVLSGAMTVKVIVGRRP
jgi:hypothetical protein